MKFQLQQLKSLIEGAHYADALGMIDLMSANANQDAAIAIKDFIDDMVGALKTNHISLNFFTIAQLHRLAEDKCKDLGFVIGNIVERHGKEVAEQCGLTERETIKAKVSEPLYRQCHACGGSLIFSDHPDKYRWCCMSCPVSPRETLKAIADGLIIVDEITNTKADDMAIGTLSVKVSVETIFQKALIEVVEGIYKDHGIKIKSIDIDWDRWSHKVQSIETTTKAFTQDLKPDEKN